MTEERQPGMASPTLETVAAAAGVSRATVSRVVNGSPKVSPETKRTVDDTIALLGYRPNHAARALVNRRTGSVALVVSEPPELVFADPMIGGMVRAFGQVLGATDTQLVLMMTQGDAERARLGDYLLGGHVDGVILMSLHSDDTLVRDLHAARIPAVLMGRPMSPVQMPYVDSDSVDAPARPSGTWRRRDGGGSRRSRDRRTCAPDAIGCSDTEPSWGRGRSWWPTGTSPCSRASGPWWSC